MPPDAARSAQQPRSPRWSDSLRMRERVGFANSGGLVFVDESAEEIAAA
jgi:hypothetical protein